MSSNVFYGWTILNDLYYTYIFSISINEPNSITRPTDSTHSLPQCVAKFRNLTIVPRISQPQHCSMEFEFAAAAAVIVVVVVAVASRLSA